MYFEHIRKKMQINHFFLAWAFSAALVVFPAPLTAALVTSLMTPTATVCFMSRTAKRPRGAYWEKTSNHGLLGDELNHSGIAGFDELGLLLHDLTGSLVDLGADLVELAGNVGGVAIEDGCVSVSDLTGVVKNDDLSKEHGGVACGVVLGVGSDVTTLNIGDGESFNIESNV